MNNETINVIRARRSIRSYTEEMIPEDILNEIIEAGRCAPSAGSAQSAKFYIIKNKSKLDELKYLVKQAFSKMEIKEGLYKSIVHSIEKSKAGGYDFIYNAPVLITLTNKKGYPNALADCVCANENMIIAAAALGIGSCYINQIHWLEDNEEIRKFLGVEDDETIACSLALGYADGEPKPIEIKGNEIIIVS